jgi:hypothetical protein
MNMSDRDRKILMALIPLVVIGAYWFLLLAPKRAEAGRLAKQLAGQQQKLTAATGELAAALQAKQDYAGNYRQVARLGQAVPADDEVQSLVFQLDAAATAAGVSFRGATLVPSTDAASATATPTPITATPAPSSSTGSSTSATPTTPAASATSAPATQAGTSTLPPGASVGPAGFPTMPFTLTFTGSFAHMAGFFHRLDDFVQAGGTTVRVGGRLLTVDGVTLATGPKGFPQIKASVAATAYLVPAADAGTTAGATAAAPAAAGGASTASAAPPTATVVPVRP